MAVPGCSAAACEVILEGLRSYKLAVPDALLQELAANYAHDTPIDIDPEDIRYLLVRPGQTMVFRGCFQDGCETDQPLTTLLAEATAKGVDLSTVTGALLVIKANSQMRRKIWGTSLSSMPVCLARALHSDAAYGHALYTDETLGNVMSLLIVFSGIGIMVADGLDAEGAGRSAALNELQGQGCFELPAFLQKSQSQESRQ
jgi:hypothetical protein